MALPHPEEENIVPIADYEAIIAARGITVQLFNHPPVATVNEARDHWAMIDAAHTKNLLLKDEGRQYWLVVMPADARLDLKALPGAIGSRRLRFAGADDLERLLGVQTGAVSPLALVNDRQNEVKLAIDKTLMSADRIAFHPLRNDATITLSPQDLTTYLGEIDHVPTLFILP